MASAQQFKSSEKFRVTMINSEGDSERVTVQIGLDGLKIQNSDTGRTMRSYDLSHISRWQSTGGSLVLYTKTPVDLEERQLTLTGDDSTVRNALDTLTCCCMQLVELLQSGRSPSDMETANNLHALVAGGGRSKKTSPTLPTADSIQYWHGAEKHGWMQCQGEQLKLWRKRWFVLKQGHLFRFMNGDLNESVKPRGVVDLSKVQDVRDGRGPTGKPNSIQLKTATGGSVCYVCDSETDQVEWLSALEGAMQKIVRQLAGVDEEAAAASKSSSKSERSGRSHSHREKHGSRSSHGRDNGGGSNGSSGLVEVVGYDTIPATAPPAGGGGSGSGGSFGSSGLSYGNIAGIRIRDGGEQLNYGGGSGGYGGGGSMLYPSTPAPSVAPLPTHSAAAPYDPNYGAYSPAGPSGYDQPLYGQQQQQPQQLLQTQPSYGQQLQQQQPIYDQGGYGQQLQQQYTPQLPSLPQQLQQPQQYAPQPQQQQQQQQQQLQQQPQQQQAYTSLIDQVPSQQPSYPTYFQAAVTQQQQPQQQAPPPPPQQTGAWQVLYTPEGRAYYFNSATNTTQWDAPAGVAA